MTRTIDFISLGCSKNLVDSENLMGLCEAYGFRVTHDSDDPQGDVVVINTCGFIADAKEESINCILEQTERKRLGEVERVYVMGCLSERYLAELEQEIPEVDGWYGKFNFRRLLDDEEAVSLREHSSTSEAAKPSAHTEGVSPFNVHRAKGSFNVLRQAKRPLQLCWLATSGTQESRAHAPQALRHLTTPSHYTYIKISEGCDRHCAYCAIPLITGHHRSRTMEDILDEVRGLVVRGVKEFNVIAQELTYYGVDLYGRQRIAELIEQMAHIEGVRWIRLHYAYPTHFPWDLLRVIRENDNVCKYLDIALQHISDHMLTRMQRHTTRQETIELIERMRCEVPGLHLRTTLMVGFPGETDDDFKELVEFTRQARFERMGAFAYSEEDGTYSAEHYPDDVPEDVKQHRLSRLMRVQQQISAEVEAAKIGQTMQVVVDRTEGDYYIARTEFCSPEVDPEVLIPLSEGPLTPGEFYDVRITESEEFDLYATII